MGKFYVNFDKNSWKLKKKLNKGNKIWKNNSWQFRENFGEIGSKLWIKFLNIIKVKITTTLNK